MMKKRTHPNVDVVARQLSAGDPNAMQQLVSYALNYTHPGIQYVTAQLDSSLSVPLAAFKAARLVMIPTTTDIL